MHRPRGDLPRWRGERTNNTSGTATGVLRKPARFTLALALALLFVVALTARPAWASTFEVDSTADTNTGACTAAANDCTLRGAIIAANNAAGTDTINFNIPESGVKTIAPTSALPAITGPVTIDGYTQGDGTADDATPNTLTIGNNAHLLIELNGTNAGLSSGLKITGANITVRGLVINQFREYGVFIDGPGTTIEGNYIGTDKNGATDLGNSSDGVVIFDHSNKIGGTTLGERNVISGNNMSGISFNCNCATGNQVQGNYIGTKANGTEALGNASNGVTMLVGAHSNTIGGTTDGARNVISSNQGDGVSLGFGGNNQVQGNYIGTDASGTTDLGNSSDGVVTSSSSGDTIGGTTLGERNIISGNNESGVTIRGTGNQVQGNYIGTDKDGTASLGNSSNGVLINGGIGNWIGGTTPGERNVISGNGSAFGGSGVFIEGVGGNQVRGNYIGTDKTGTAPLGNRFRGVVILDAANNTIGGTEPGAGNIISGNTLSGVFIKGTTTPGNQVRGNYIGTDKNGTAPLGNSAEGVNIDSGSGDTIGGTAPGAGNVISSNQGAGVFIGGSGSQVQGNYIGTDKSGTRPAGAPDLGNSTHGVDVGSQGTNNTIGGTASEARNVISDNNASGVLVSGNSNQVQGNYVGTDASGTASLGNSFDGVAVGGTNNAILSNSIFSNGDLGIDLNHNGATLNDPQDPDFGANNLQNFPVIGSASLNADGTATISVTLNSTPSTTFTIQLYSSPNADPSGFGEGKTFLGEKTDVVTNSSGNASFSFTSASAIPAGELVSATATDPSGNTSEFSQVTVAQDITAPDPPKIVGPPNNSFNTTGTITLSGTAEANSTVEIFEATSGTTSKGTTTVGSSGAWTKALSGVRDGTHTYTAKARDAAGNISSASNARTVIVDTREPTIKGVTPTAGATGVAPRANVHVFFSEPMRATSINRTTFKLYKKGSITPIPADVKLDPSNSRKAILDPRTALPNGYLQRGTTYKAVVTRGVKDRAGNALAASKVWFFTVRP